MVALPKSSSQYGSEHLIFILTLPSPDKQIFITKQNQVNNIYLKSKTLMSYRYYKGADLL